MSNMHTLTLQFPVRTILSSSQITKIVISDDAIDDVRQLLVLVLGVFLLHRHLPNMTIIVPLPTDRSLVSLVDVIRNVTQRIFRNRPATFNRSLFA